MKLATLSTLLGLCAVVACSDSTGTPTAPNYNVTSGAQYKSVSDEIALPSGDLLVSFDESGVGNAAGTTLEQVFYHVDALFACKNGGGNWPADPKKQGVSFEGSYSQEFANHGGRTRGTMEVPAPASTLDCPSGQGAVLVAIQYVSTQSILFRLYDATNGVTWPLADIKAVLDATYNRDTTLPQ